MPKNGIHLVNLCQDRDRHTSLKVNLLLLHITPYDHFPGSFSEPVGIEQLAGTINENLISKFASINLSLGMIESDEGLGFFIEHICSVNYTHIGLGMPIGSYETALIILEKIKAINKNTNGHEHIKVFIGGNLPTSLPEKYLVELVERFPFVIVVRGWGDKPLLSLLERELSLSDELLENISGLIYSDDKKIYVNPLLPNYTEDFIAGKPLRVLLTSEMVANLVVSENCSHPHCTFCARMPFIGREKWIPKPINQIIEQMADFSILGILQGTFTDEEALGTTPEHAKIHAWPLARAIIEAKRAGKIHSDFRFAFSTRSDSIVGLAETDQLEILEDLKKAGLSRIFLGVESGVPHDFRRWDELDIPSQGKRYGKGVKVQDHLNAIAILKKLDIDIEIGFIAFDPLIDLGEIQENARFILENNLAQNTSNIFTKLRIQSGARYPILMQNILKRIVYAGQLNNVPRLLGKFDPSTLQTDYVFMHSLVEKFGSLIADIKKETRYPMYTLKSYYRSKIITGEITEGVAFNTIVSLREIELNLLIALPEWAENKLKERGIPRKEYNRLTFLFDEDNEIEMIKRSHREERNKIWIKFLQTDIPGYLREAITSRLQI